MKALSTLLLAIMFAFASVLSVHAQDDGFNVTWTVAESNQYTVEDNGGQPTVSFNDCLVANQTYTINFSVTVETEGSYEATFATVGEGSQNLIPQGFNPATVSGDGTQTFEATATFRARDVSFSNAPDSFGVYLEGPDEAVLGESFMAIAFDCITQNGQGGTPLPPTGASDVLRDNMPLAMLGGVLALLGGYAVRRRLMVR